MSAFPEIAHPPALVVIDIPNDRSLRLVIEERTGLGMAGIYPPGIVAREIVRAAQDARFEVFWDVVVCFMTRGDPFPKQGAGSTATLIEIREAGPFLEWVKEHCHADPDYVAAMTDSPDLGSRSLRHWQVSTSEALFDVASFDPPIVRRLT
jgi:hypothetical protein